tara:strand:+ start:887 stop:1045 length:159 start_codon:yes stop_codon:yes gene_type:complete
MPLFGLGLFIGDTDADSQVGPPTPGGGPDGVIQTESEDFLQVEAGQFLAFDE